VCERSPVPVFSLNKNTLGSGVVGGKVNDGLAQGRVAGEMAVAVLRGTPPRAIGIQRESPNPYVFDYRQLERWHIPQSALPPASIFINRPRSFYTVHPFWFWSITSFVILQAVAIVLLLLQRRRRKAAESALLAHSRQLARSNYMLEQVAYVAAHDLQEPSRTVAIFAEMLGRRSGHALDSESERALQFILGAAQRMHGMVQGLLNWVRAVDEESRPKMPVSSSEVVERVVQQHADLTRRRGASIRAEGLPEIRVHEQHLVRIFDQLLLNALQHGGNGTREIGIAASRINNAWRFSVSDNGAGIAPELHARIFGVFKRLEPERAGIGMGLPICRRIVEHYGGRIWVESNRGEGTTFLFTIPDDDASRVVSSR
jgi:light-regulated signal transduction histidine kinase (bacteriophytochrome)